MRRIKNISSEAYISLICYMLIGKSVHKININSLHNLCLKIKEYYNTNNILYSKLALLSYINTYKDVDNYKHIRLFSYINDEIIFPDNIYDILQSLNSMFANVNKDEFFNLYSHINSFINMYQLIDNIL